MTTPLNTRTLAPIMQSASSFPTTRRSYAAAIFDFEGTLVDFQWRLERAERELRSAFAEFGFDGEHFMHGNYATMWNAAADLLAGEARMEDLRRALCPIYDRWDSDALTRWTPRPGAVTLLARLVAGGSRAGMVSNVGRRAFDQVSSRFGLARWLSPVVTRDEVTWMKPRPEGILRVLLDWQLAPADALFVGDSRADVLAARAAGMPVAIVRGGECEDAQFADTRPDYMVSQLDELAGLMRLA